MPVLVPTQGQNLAVNGVDLSQYAVITQSNAPMMGTPKKRGKNITVPGRHGAIRLPRKRYEPSDFVLKLLVLGANPDGTIPTGSTAARMLYANADALHRLFEAETVLLTRTMPDGTQRQATAEVTDVIDWTRDLGQTPLLGLMTVGFVLPDAFWFDAVTATQTVNGVTGSIQTLTAFQGATAPMADLTLTAYGPVNNPSWQHGDKTLQYQGVLSTGQQLVVDVARYRVTPGTGSVWSPDPRQVSFTPGPAWFELEPSVTPFTVKFVHTTGNGVSASSLVAGPRKFLSA